VLSIRAFRGLDLWDTSFVIQISAPVIIIVIANMVPFFLETFKKRYAEIIREITIRTSGSKIVETIFENIVRGWFSIWVIRAFVAVSIVMLELVYVNI